MRKKIEIEKEYTLILWDTGGHERFMPILSPMYYRNVCCCLFVFSIDNLESFDALEKHKNQFMEVISKENFPFVLVGNKLDLKNEQCQVEIEKAKSWCTQNGGMPYVETSAKDGRGVFEAFEMVTKRFSDLSQDEQTLLLTKQSVVPDTTNDNYPCC